MFLNVVNECILHHQEKKPEHMVWNSLKIKKKINMVFPWLIGWSKLVGLIFKPKYKKISPRPTNRIA
jgi:hypothetical protein